MLFSTYFKGVRSQINYLSNILKSDHRKLNILYLLFANMVNQKNNVTHRKNNVTFPLILSSEHTHL